jgi:excisionase family DNA binding protein
MSRAQQTTTPDSPSPGEVRRTTGRCPPSVRGGGPAAIGDGVRPARREAADLAATGTEVARVVIDAVRADPTLAAGLVEALRPHLQDGDAWMTSRQAAEHIGLTLAALHRLTAARVIPFEQDVPGGKCWFNRADLDAWRRSGRLGTRRVAAA